ncbi:MAG TPA: DUF882 domain-containing protein [Campylobacterales bacterium]|nr:DUF882 domain-containing protein [Campylobacterales bacterium]
MNRRREFLKKSLIVGTGFIVSPAELFSLSLPIDKTLILHNSHTGESIKSTFWSKDHYVKSEVKRLNHFFRDFRQNETAKMDKNLYQLLYGIQLVSNSKKPVDILSGFRSIKTNKKLRRYSKGVAKRSYHVRAKAIDFNISDRYVKQTLKLARMLELGGVGYYPKSGFVHIDTGPIRYWRG